MTAQTILNGGISTVEATQGLLTILNDPTAATSALVKAFGDLTAVAAELGKKLDSYVSTPAGKQVLHSAFGAAGAGGTVTAFGAAAYQLGEAFNDFRVAYEQGASAAQMSQLRMNFLDKTLGLTSAAGNMLMLSPVPQLKVVGAGMWLLGTGVQQITNGNAGQLVDSISAEFSSLWSAHKPSQFSLVVYGDPWANDRSVSENLSLGLSPEGYPLDKIVTIGEGDFATTFRVLKQGDYYVKTSFTAGTQFKSQISQNEFGEVVKGEFSASLRPGVFGKTYKVDFTQSANTSTRLVGEILPDQLIRNDLPSGTPTIEVDGVPGMPGYVTETTIENGTTKIRLLKIDGENYESVLTSGDNAVMSFHPVSRVASVPWGNGGTESYDPVSGRRIFQYADGSGFATAPRDINGLPIGGDIEFAAGGLSTNASTGVVTISPSNGGASVTLFERTNFISLTTNTTNPTPSQTPTPDSTSGGPSTTNNTLVSTGDYSVGIGNFWDVNTAGGNQAAAGYAITDGLRPGNSNIGLNINASTGIGLNVPAPSGNTDPGIGAIDYSLFGSSLNNAAASNFYQIPVDPLVLDLNGDGVKLTNYTDSPVLFDADNDGGSLEQTGWVSSQDGIVVHDLNHDGKINNISETLSEYYNGVAGSNGMAGTKPFANGFAALKSLDSNHDNQFTSADAAWSELRVWQDANHDGKTDAGELKSFADLGITAINLNTTAQSGEVRDGNEVLAKGSFAQNGTTQEAIAANFLANPAGSTVTQSGSGIIVSTENMVNGGAATTAFVSKNTVASVSESLSTATLGVKNITGGAGNDSLVGDAQNNWLAGGLGADSLNGGAGDDVLLIDASDTSINGGDGLDVAQVIGSQGVTLNLSESNIEIAVGGDGNDVFIGGGRSTVFVRGGAGDDVIIGGAANDVLSGEDGADLIDGGAGNDLIRGHRGQDQLLGGQGDDVLDGGLEDDTLSGGAGNDVLIGGRGDDKLNGGDGIDVAQYSGSYADYRITRIRDEASGGTTFRVVDTRTGEDGADTLTNIEKLSFSDVSRVDLTLAAPLPVKDILSVNSSGAALSRTTAHLLSKNQLLANDRDWDSDISQLSITAVLEAKGGTVSLTAQGDVLFTPDASYTGVMSFKYKVQDAQGNYTQVTSGTGQTEPMKAAVYLQTTDLPSDPLVVEQWYLSDTNVIAAWGTVAEQAAGRGYSGKGIKIGQFEPGGPFSTGPEIFDYRHPDLAPNADKAWLNTLDANGNSNTPQVFSNHATMVAGVMVAARNGEGGVGVAYNASLAGHYIQGEGLEVSQLNQEITNALAKFKNYDVVNNSWGPTANFQLNVTPVGLLETGMLDAVSNGRGGLGTAIVMAGGNDREHGANTNYNALTANRAVITVGSINAPGDLGTLQMGSKPFSNPGSSILVSAPGSNIDSTSRELIADNGSTFGSDYNTSQGTSFAAPIVSGVIALMLEANPRLGYRDIQTILAMSATQFTDPNGTDWTYNTAKNWNGGGMHASHDYGFGKVDARAAVRLAETWYGQATTWNEQTKTASSATLNAAIPDGAGVLTQTLTMAAGLDVETAQVTLELTHQRWGDLIIKLISPTGTESILVNRPGKAPGSAASDLGDTTSGTLSFSFNTTHVRGETSGGNWTLQVIDAATGSTGTLKNWKLDLYGATSDSDDVYVYTNEFASTAGRTTLTDTNGGSDIINASAVTGNSTINLNNGSTSTLAGKMLTLNGDIDKAFGGDGNDTLIGNAGVNVLIGGRGNDTITGGGGLDRLEGGYGNDTLTGGTEDDLFVVYKDAGGTDTITDFNTVSGAEKIVLVGFEGVTDATQLSFTQLGANVQIGLGQGQFIILSNTTVAQVSEQNFVFVSDASFVDEYAVRWNNPGFWLGTTGVDNQLINSAFGDVRATALAGDDVLGATTANDLLDGGNGNDTLWGDYPGFTPVPGADWIEGGSGSDTLYGGSGGDWLVGGSGDDAEYGEDGNDYLIGNTGVDFLDGGLGDDLITLDGDVGTVNGTTFGYYGTRVGGAGADVFKVLANGGGNAGFSAAGGTFSASNLIADFDPNQAGEKIDLRAFSWITSLADLGIQNLNINGVQFARISVSNGAQSLNLNIRGVSPSQLNAGHFVFAPGTPGVVTGTAGNDTLTGDAGANTLNGLAGADSMTGRTGDDSYIVDNVGDTINELPGGGYDSVQSSVSYSLGDNVEALTLTGAGNLNATGNAQRNRLVGNAGANRLDGGAEADSMLGGAGSDTYVVDDQLDTVYENFNEGTDKVESSVSWTLGSNFENLTLTGTGNVNATGNDVSNILVGNSADNIIDGAQGADVMSGGAGNDTFYVDNVGDTAFEEANAGIDTVYTSVNMTLEANVENGALFGAATTLTGNGLANTLLGNSLANTLSGGAGNDVLDGGAGVDAMVGGTGDDVYFVDNAGDTVSENLAEGTDTVVASLNYTLGANTENLVLAGSANLSGTGNALDNQISGNSGNNTLNGGSGNDVLDGGAGADAMTGGTGDDTYYVDAAGDTVSESAGEGTDTVVSALGYSLGANLENLTLSGFGNTNATGNSLANTLQGNGGNNILDGGSGADSLRGNVGSDVLRGGIGNDSYLFALGDGPDTVEENDSAAGNIDTLSFGPGIAPAAVTVSRSGQDLVLAYGAGDSVTVKNWFAGSAQKIEQVSFADGSNWNVAQLTALANLAPVISSPVAAQVVNEDAVWTFTVPANTFADADVVIGDSLGYSASLANGAALPSWLSFDAQTRTFAGTPSNADVGSLNLRVTATDTSGAAVSSAFTVTIANTNDAPTVANALANLSAAEDAAWSFTVPAGAFADVDSGDSLSYSAKLANGDALPGWISFNVATRTFSGTPSNGEVGTVGLRVTATDAAGASVFSNFTVTVTNTNDAPTLAAGIGNQAAAEDAAWSFTVPAGTFADVDAGDSLSYSATLANGDALPGWLSFNAATRTFSGTPLNGDVGNLGLKVTATDAAGASVSSNFSVAVANTNDAPAVALAIAGQSATEDAVWSFTVPAGTFADVDAGDSLSYSATLANGDALPGWLSFNTTTRTFSGTPLNGDVGSLGLKVTATDAAGASASSSFSVAVTNTNDAPAVALAIAGQSATEDAVWNFTVPAGTFADVDAGDSLSYSATLANGDALPGWLSFNAVTRTFSGTPGNSEVGSLSLKVTATDLAGASASSFFIAAVANVNDAPTVTGAISGQSLPEDTAWSFTVPAGTFADADAGDSLSYGATLANGEALPGWLHFDAVTRTFSGTPGNADVGTLSLQLTATDAAGASTSSTFSVAVANVNDAPTVASAIAGQSATEGAAWTYTVPAGTFADVDAGDSLSYSATLANGDALPSWVSFDALTRTFSGTPLNANVGSLILKVSAGDAAGAVVSTTLNLDVLNTNDAPTVSHEVAAQSVAAESLWTFTVAADVFDDVDAGDSLSWSALSADGSPLPEWLAFDVLTRTFTGIPPNTSLGVIGLKVIAADSAGATVSSDFNLVVASFNHAPGIANPLANQDLTEDVAWSYKVPADAFTDTDAGDSLSYAATLANGDALPAWLSFDAVTRTFSGTPGNADTGGLSFKVTATDSAGASASSTFSVAVANANDAPELATAIAGQSVAEDSAWSFTVPAGSFTDVDAGDSLSYSATLANGDALPAWLSFDAATRTFSGTPGNAVVGNLSFKVTATDAAGATASGVFSVAVANTNDAPTETTAIAAQATGEDAVWSFTVPSATFSDMDAGDTLVYSAALGNGGALPAWLSFDAATRTFSGIPLNADVGNLNLRVTVTDPGGAHASSEFVVAIANTNDAPTVVNAIGDQSATEDAAWSYTVSSEAFADIDAGDSLSYSATLGNGDALPGWLSFDPVTRTFSGTPLSGDAGILAMKVTAVDSAGATVSSDFHVIVAAPNHAPVLVNPLANQDAPEDSAWSYTIPLDAFEDTDLGDTLGYSATLANGEALPAWLVFDSATRTFSGTPANADVGSLIIKVSATDAAGLSVTSTFDLAVSNTNDAPTAGVPLPDQLVSEGSPWEFVLPTNTFIDVDAGDVLTLSAGLPNGDPLPSWISFDAVTGTFSGTPPGEVAEPILVYVTATDSGGATAVISLSIASGHVLTGTEGADTLTGTPGVDQLYGLAGDDVMDGGAGLDTLAGGTGNDSYVIDASNDLVVEMQDEGTDVVFASVSYALTENVEDLVLTGSDAISGTGNSANNTLTGNSEANSISGGEGNDTLIGGAGNDMLDGGAGGDVYLYKRGDGSDTIADYDLGDGSTDTLRFDSSIAVADITVTRDAARLYLNIAGTTDQITLDSWPFNDGSPLFERVEFSDGTVWSGADLLAKAVFQGTAGDDGLYGTAGVDVMNGGAGDDVVLGDAGNDMLSGDTGNDMLDGGAGSDVYLYKRGDGSDHIIDYDMGDGSVDVIRFDSSIAVADISVTRDAANLYLNIAGTTDQITLDTWPVYDGLSIIERVEFSDGTAWSGTDILAKAVFRGTAGDDVLSGTYGGDTFDGGAGNDYIDGGPGADVYLYKRGDGSDVIIDNDWFQDGSIDTLRFDSSIAAADITVTRDTSNFYLNIAGTSDQITLGGWFSNGMYKIERVEFSDGMVWSDADLESKAVYQGTEGDDTLYGGVGVDVFEGGAGNDTLDGGTGSDVYLYKRGDGSDRIFDYDGGDGSVDVIRFDSSIAVADISVTRDAANLYLNIAGTTDQITLDTWPVYDGLSIIERIEFSNGTVWSGADVLAKAVFRGTAGDDSLSGTYGGDTFDGGSGNDYIDGGPGADVYLYKRGDGSDVIIDNDWFQDGSIDTLRFDSSIVAADITVTRDASNLYLNIAGTSDQITLGSWFSGGTYKIERVEFSDGMVWSDADLQSKAVYHGTEGDDSLYGGVGVDVFEGGAGNDTLDGGTGSDVYLYKRGDGSDHIIDYDMGDGSVDVIRFDSSISVADISVTRDASNLYLNIAGTTDQITLDTWPVYDGLSIIERVEFSDGTVWSGADLLAKAVLQGTAGDDSLYGTAGADVMNGGAGDDILASGEGNDTLSGGAGNDTLYGDGGGDLYLYKRGDGSDTIYDYDQGDGSIDTLRFDSSITVADVFITRDRYNFHLNFAETTDQITLASWPNNDGLSVIERVEFSDGTMWSGADILSKAVFGGTAGDDLISGTVDADMFQGGAGNDWLYGDVGSDVYLYSRGDGSDTIQEDDWNINTDILRFDNSIAASDVTVTRDAAHLYFGIAGSTDRITILNWGYGEGYQIERVEFADGTAWSHLDLQLRAVYYGTSGDDALYGAPGVDVLDGGTGNDFLDGNAGGDVYLYKRGDGSDVIADYGQDGEDTLRFDSSIAVADIAVTRDMSNMYLNISGTTDQIAIGSWPTFDGLTLIERVEFADGTVWSSADILSKVVFQGTAGDDGFSGTSGDDTFNGGAGSDILDGGTGNDVYLYKRGDGSDTIYDADWDINIDILRFDSSIVAADVTVTRDASNLYLSISGTTDQITLGNWMAGEEYQIERVEFADGTVWSSADLLAKAMCYGTEGDDYLVGTDGNDVLQGLSGDDTLDGGAGADTMLGGQGNDSYLVDNTGDIVTESPDEGIDTVQSSITYTLGSDVENLTLTGSGAINATGNALDNILAGNEAANVLKGGLGDDTYVVNAGDTVTELAGQGTDTVVADYSYTLGTALENLTLSGYADINATGNALDNVIVGNDGSNLINGGTGADTLMGGYGDDTYTVDNLGDTVIENPGEGADTVNSSISFTLTSDVENLSLTGSTNINATGNDLNNTLTGNAGGNILDGGAGADMLVGGKGNDTYIVDDANDVIVENAAEGTDTVQSSVDYTLADNLENLVLTGEGAVNAFGNAANNILTGNTTTNSLSGDAGNDTLDGGGGADTLIGGLGNDTYLVDDGGVVIVEALGEGTDVVKSSVSYALSDNVENLTLLGYSAVDGTGNDLNNVLTGNASMNTLAGGAGLDTLNGAGGADTLIGGLGNDTYQVDDTGVVIVEAAAEGTDLVKNSVDYTLSDNVENMTMSGAADISGTGNDLNNVLTGNAGNNTLSGGAGNDTLNGGAGADTLAGGLGNDTYVVDSAADLVVEAEGEGTDAVQSSVTYALSANVENITLTGTGAIDATGNALDNVMTGNAGMNTLAGGDGNDTLDGKAGADTMLGGLGNDIYTVDNVADAVLENASEGTDLVNSALTYTLAANVENLTLTGTAAIDGTGNSLDNLLTGNAAANTLVGGDGNDTLDGKAGADTMAGGLGNDVYFVDATGDAVNESAGEGTDIVNSAVTYALGTDVENLTLTGSTAINGTGNTLDNVLTGNAGINTLTGGAGNDTLDGKAGADSLIGGVGDDTYVLDNAGDVVTENAGEGMDRVQSSVTHTLALNVEVLGLTGTAAINGTGNASDNLVLGNGGNNTLNGAGGNDILQGGGGTDIVTDTVGNNLLDGGAGNDTLTGGTGNEFIAGGLGNDTINTSTGADIIAFNRGDGQDSVNLSTGSDNTLSLGKGITYADLLFTKSSNDLILGTGTGEQITFKGWYANVNNHSVANLQIVIEGTADYDANSASQLANKKIERFDFGGLAARFDQARVANPALTSWALSSSLLEFYLNGSDTAAIGGDLAYQYAKSGNLSDVSMAPAQALLAGASFGTGSQSLQLTSALQDSSPRLL